MTAVPPASYWEASLPLNLMKNSLKGWMEDVGETLTFRSKGSCCLAITGSVSTSSFWWCEALNGTLCDLHWSLCACLRLSFCCCCFVSLLSAINASGWCRKPNENPAIVYVIAAFSLHLLGFSTTAICQSNSSFWHLLNLKSLMTCHITVVHLL